MEEQKNTEEKKSSARKIIFPVILGIVVIVIGIYIFNKVTYNMKHEETDDAQVDATIYPILPRVTGYVDSVNFSDNDNVRNGELLVKIDDRDLIIKVAQAQAALENAQASVSVAQSG